MTAAFIVPSPPVAADDELARLDALGQAELVRTGQATPRELVEAAIGRIARLDPQLNAVIHHSFDAALVAADNPHLPDGPFRGVPFLLKDLWPSAAGEPMHLGNQAMKNAGYCHPTDANLVTAYRRAGFVLCGRTNTPELGLVATTEPLAYGPTHNPWNTAHSPGGSSGGAAAAVAARLVPVANASDGGGSIRIPASACGLIGLKPSRGRVSMGPLHDEWGVSVQHVVAISMRDCAAALDVSAVRFPGDGVHAPGPQRPYAHEIGADPGRLRIGLLASAVTMATDPECEAAARTAAALLESFGHHVEEVHPPALAGLAKLGQSFSTVWAVTARANLIRLGTMIGRELGPDDVEPSTWLLAEVGANASAVELALAYGLQHQFRRDVMSWWGDGWDLLVSPTMAALPPKLGVCLSRAEDPVAAFRESAPYSVFTSWVNVSGQPAISLPLRQSATGLPIGVQLVADYGREDVLLRVGSQLLG